MTTTAESILDIMAELRGKGVHGLHGYRIAKEIKERRGSKGLLGYGTLYRALASLEEIGFLVSRWEDWTEAAEERRPRRKLYRLASPSSPVIPECTELYRLVHGPLDPQANRFRKLLASVRKTTEERLMKGD